MCSAGPEKYSRNLSPVYLNRPACDAIQTSPFLLFKISEPHCATEGVCAEIKLRGFTNDFFLTSYITVPLPCVTIQTWDNESFINDFTCGLFKENSPALCSLNI